MFPCSLPPCTLDPMLLYVNQAVMFASTVYYEQHLSFMSQVAELGKTLPFAYFKRRLSRSKEDHHPGGVAIVCSITPSSPNASGVILKLCYVFWFCSGCSYEPPEDGPGVATSDHNMEPCWRIFTGAAHQHISESVIHSQNHCGSGRRNFFYFIEGEEPSLFPLTKPFHSH